MKVQSTDLCELRGRNTKMNAHRIYAALGKNGWEMIMDKKNGNRNKIVQNERVTNEKNSKAGQANYIVDVEWRSNYTSPIKK